MWCAEHTSGDATTHFGWTPLLVSSLPETAFELRGERRGQARRKEEVVCRLLCFLHLRMWRYMIPYRDGTLS